MNRRLLLVGVGALALLVLLFNAWQLRPRQPVQPRVMVGGGDGGGLPRAQPADERLDGAALERAMRDPAAGSLQVLVIMRDDHLVFERYGRGLSGDTVIDSGPFAQVLVALVAGVAAKAGALAPTALHDFDANALRAAIEAGTQQHYEDYLSRQLWGRVNAAGAWIALPASAAPAPADCCLHARVLDWLRIAGLLVNDGRFEGKQIVPPGWVQRMASPLSLDSVRGLGVELAASAHGAEPFAANGVFFVRGPGRWRLWLLPQLKLAILFGAQSPPASAPPAEARAMWDETRLPNLVLRAVSDRSLQRGDATDLQGLVPGH
jgi:hypothetical protein